MPTFFPFLLTGLAFGLAAGISPGPLMTLILTETLRHGRGAGLKIAMAPLLTDAPILAGSLLVVSQLSQLHAALGAISIVGGAFVAYLGYESLVTKGLSATTTSSAPSTSLAKGFLVNALNPHPYLFCLTVAAPIVLAAAETGWPSVVAFLAAFFACLVGCNVAVALLAHSARSFLKSGLYVWVMRGLGIVLVGFAIRFVWDGIAMIANSGFQI